MDKTKITEIKQGLQPLLKRLEAQGKPLSTSYIKPFLDNDNTSPFTLVVQADWLDKMPLLNAIQYLFASLRESGTTDDIMKSIYAIRVVQMTEDIASDKPYYYIIPPLNGQFTA